MGPDLQYLQEILHNHTEECPDRYSHPVNFEEIRIYLIEKKATQKKYHDKSHNIKLLPELKPGQQVLFLSTIEQS